MESAQPGSRKAVSFLTSQATLPSQLPALHL